TITNPTDKSIEIGSLGIPMIFNNIINNRTLDQAHAKCVFYDPYIGMDAGYIQVTRLTGKGPVLLVTPEPGTPLEAYNPILNFRDRQSGGTRIFNDPTPRGVTFEGSHEWMVHSRAYAENEWKKAEPWNEASSFILEPGKSRTYGLQFHLAPEIRKIESTLTKVGRSVAVGIPGYVLPQDVEGKLFLKSNRKIARLDVEPKGAIAVRKEASTKSGWSAFEVRGQKWGRARLTITFADKSRQTVHYRVIKPQAQAVADMGNFLFTNQWFVDENDPFKRSPGVITYDRETNKQVTQDSRVWVAGMGDEGGSGSWLAAAMKQFLQPNREEIAKLEQFVDKVVWGGLQYSEGPLAHGVRKSLFYYQPDLLGPDYYRKDLNWGSWTSWNKKTSELVDRSFNYPHVAALHWVMYRLARNHPELVTNHSADWYLENAFGTTMAMMKHAGYYTQFGQMEGDVFVQILLDLQREGKSDMARQMEATMKRRADHWRSLAYPFGSEMPWDSTGQEEVYAWTHYFKDDVKSSVTLNAILGYMPTVAHWGYNGSARRYWDFLYGGKISRIERQLHHYGSGINAIPVLTEYRDHPDDLYLLRVGYGGTMGALTNIDEEGFASAAFHSFPDTLKFDPLSGDYGPNFFGHAMNAATYLVNDPEFGWISFGGNVKSNRDQVTLTPLDSGRMRVFIAPYGLWLTLDAGQFERVEVNTKSGAVKVVFAKPGDATKSARLRIETMVQNKRTYAPMATYPMERGAFVIPLIGTGAELELVSPR
ncbi:MAG: DUF5695 domain-containing protein, partial [Chthonomonadales bacterium]